MRRGIAGDDHLHAGALRILKLGANVVVFILREVDRADCRRSDAGGLVIVERLLLVGGGGRRQMVLRVLEVDGRDFELLEEADQMGAIEVAEGVAAHPEPYRKIASDCWLRCTRSPIARGRCCRRDCHCTQSKKGSPLK